MRSGLIGYVCVFVLLSSAHTLGRNRQTGSSQASPIGRWKTVDDATGKPNSVVVIWEANGKLFGKIEKLLDSDPDPRCNRCEGELKDRSLIGLQILWDLRKEGDEWSGGRILDPDNGKIYRCYIALEDGGKRLKVRGYIGVSLLGRTEYWLRDQ
jgi:uncharacterized protein (DUF2147 family)